MENETTLYAMENDYADYFRWSTLRVCMIITIISLAILLVTFYLGNETQFLHGKNILCHSLALLITFVSVRLEGFGVQIFPNYDLPFCYIIGFISYFGSMSTILWLNATCFDVFWTFSSIIKTRGYSNGHKFKLYSIYACTLPLFMTTALTIATFTIPHSSSWSTGVRTSCCFIMFAPANFFKVQMMFFFGPLVLACLSNIMLIGITSIQLFKTQRELQEILNNENTYPERFEKKQKLILQMNLFSLMGVFWITEFINTVIDDHSGIWHIFSILNCLRGLWLLIFWVIMNKRLISELKRNKFSRVSSLLCSVIKPDKALQSDRFKNNRITGITDTTFGTNVETADRLLGQEELTTTSNQVSKDTSCCDVSTSDDALVPLPVLHNAMNHDDV